MSIAMKASALSRILNATAKAGWSREEFAKAFDHANALHVGEKRARGGRKNEPLDQMVRSRRRRPSGVVRYGFHADEYGRAYGGHVVP